MSITVINRIWSIMRATLAGSAGLGSTMSLPDGWVRLLIAAAVTAGVQAALKLLAGWFNTKG